MGLRKRFRDLRLVSPTLSSYVWQVTKTGMTVFNSTKYSFNRPCPFLVIRYCLRAFPWANSQFEDMSCCFSKCLSSVYRVDGPRRMPNFLYTTLKMAYPCSPRSDVSFMMLSRTLSRIAPRKIFLFKTFKLFLLLKGFRTPKLHILRVTIEDIKPCCSYHTTTTNRLQDSHF